VAYPPAALPTTRVDGTATAGTHPLDHNSAHAAINDIVAELGANPAGNLADVTRNSWETIKRQSVDVTQAAAAFAVNSDLDFPFVANGVYVVELFLLMRSSLATAGFRLALDTSVAVTAVAITFNHVLANTGTITAGQSRADATATGLSSGVDTINVDVPVIGGGLLVAGATPGTAELAYGPEVAATTTLRANSVMRVQRIA
jgi:hypothetical protein